MKGCSAAAGAGVSFARTMATSALSVLFFFGGGGGLFFFFLGGGGVRVGFETLGTQSHGNLVARS